MLSIPGVGHAGIPTALPRPPLPRRILPVTWGFQLEEKAQCRGKALTLKPLITLTPNTDVPEVGVFTVLQNIMQSPC